MIILFIKFLIAIYLVLALLLSFSMVLLNKQKLKKLRWWQQLLLFVLSPVVFIKEFIGGKKR